VKPSEVSKKKLFLNVKDPKENIIFAICSHYCKAYDIECKPKKPELQGSIYYLSSLGKPPETKKIRRVACADEDQLLSRFVAEVNALDPDFLVCHDACNALDALISRLEKLKNNQVGKLGRLVKAKQLPRNMNQKIHAVISGRLLIDTFVHAKDMMRSVDYSLANMSKVIPGGRELNTFDR
jgi:DNA polymerase elongation subunit (family B)